MTIASQTQTDLRLREAVFRRLASDPKLDATAIGVAARGGVITLTGFVDNYSGWLEAERDAKQVRGVRAVANELRVRLMADRRDVDIAYDVRRALQSQPSTADHVHAVVHNGRVTLTGSVQWFHQRAQAENAVKTIRGVVVVINRIAVGPAAVLISA
jgi:osmotically-inducible protein OsmY